MGKKSSTDSAITPGSYRFRARIESKRCRRCTGIYETIGSMRFYFDENIAPRIARALAILTEVDQIEVYSNVDEFKRGVPDEEWIPAVEKNNGIVITQDLNIHRTRHQRELYKKHGVGVVFFKPPKKFGYP